MIQEIVEKKSIIFGCGNILFGDDGFGPAVADYLAANYSLPDYVAAVDVGTSVRDFLFDIILSEKKPRQIIIVDAADHPEREPGELFEIEVDEIDPAKIHDFSLHQFPTTNMLKELKQGAEVDVRIMVAKPAHIPDHVSQGLSVPMTKAVCQMCEKINSMFNGGRNDHFPGGKIS